MSNSHILGCHFYLFSYRMEGIAYRDVIPASFALFLDGPENDILLPQCSCCAFQSLDGATSAVTILIIGVQMVAG